MYINVLNDFKKIRSEQKSDYIEKLNTGNLPEDLLTPKNFINPKRRFTKNLIRKVGTKNSSTLLNNLYNNIRKRKFGSFADMNESNVINLDKNNIPLFKNDSLNPDENINTFGNNIEQNENKLSNNLIAKVQNNCERHNSSGDDDTDSIQEKTKNNVRNLCRLNTVNNPNLILDKDILSALPLRNSIIGRGFIGGKKNCELSPTEDIKKMPRGFKASMVSQGSKAGKGSFLVSEEQFHEIKQLKNELNMYKTCNDMLISKIQNNEIVRNEIKNMLITFESKNEEIYKIELNNLQMCYETYQAYYEDELKARKEIIENLCKIIEDLKMK